MKKRGQITVFIIIGIFLLLLLGSILYFRSEKDEGIKEEVVPENLVPVKAYVDQCIKETAENAVHYLGAQGGYIYLPDRIRLNPESYINYGGLRVPYWYYKERSRIPTLAGMQAELDRFIGNNLNACLQDFTSLEDQFEIAPEDNMTVTSVITDTGVDVTVIFPIDVRIRGEESWTRISRFNANIDVKLKKMFELAKEIMQAENSQMYFEDVTIDLMSLGPDIPFTDVQFDCGQKTWYLPDIEDEIKNLLKYNLPKIRIKGTDYLPFEAHYSKYELLRGYKIEDIAAGREPKDTPSDAYDYFHLFWDPTVNSYTDLKAFVYYYPEWDFKIYANPSRGDVLRSSSGRGSTQYWLSFLCINAYHFTYDIIYPVQIAVRDDSAFSGTGFSFRFAFPVQIHNNKGQRSNFDIETYDYPEVNDGGYCQDLLDTETFIYAIDKKTHEDILDANITFNCMNTDYCYLGSTDTQFGRNMLSVRLPGFCAPPTLEAEHKDYAKASTTIRQGAAYADIVMTPLKNMAVQVVKSRLTAGDLMQEESLGEGESAIIYLETDQLEDYSIYMKFPSDADTPSDMRTIRLPDDDLTYRLEIILLDKNSNIIGGYRGNWTVDDKNLIGKDTIKFRTLEYIPHPGNTEETARMILLLEGGAYSSRLQPEFTSG